MSRFQCAASLPCELSLGCAVPVHVICFCAHQLKDVLLHREYAPEMQYLVRIRYEDPIANRRRRILLSSGMLAQ